MRTVANGPTGSGNLETIRKQETNRSNGEPESTILVEMHEMKPSSSTTDRVTLPPCRKTKSTKAWMAAKWAVGMNGEGETTHPPGGNVSQRHNNTGSFLQHWRQSGATREIVAEENNGKKRGVSLIRITPTYQLSKCELGGWRVGYSNLIEIFDCLSFLLFCDPPQIHSPYWVGPRLPYMPYKLCGSALNLFRSLSEVVGATIILSHNRVRVRGFVGNLGRGLLGLPLCAQNNRIISPTCSMRIEFAVQQEYPTAPETLSTDQQHVPGTSHGHGRCTGASIYRFRGGRVVCLHLLCPQNKYCPATY